MLKGQAAIDFLMTYGWALLLVVLVVGALFALGIFDVGSFVGSRASGFANIGVVGWKLESNGTLTLMLENHAGASINVTSINATMGTQSIKTTSSFNLDNGKQSGIVNVGTFTNPDSKGASYNIRIEIEYKDKKTGFTYMDSGTVAGKVN